MNPSKQVKTPVADLLDATTDAKELLRTYTDGDFSGGDVSSVQTVSPMRRRSIYDKLTAHRKPREMFVRWEGDSLQFLWLYPSGKSIYTNIVKNADDDCYVHYGMYSATHSESYSVIQTKNYTSRTGTWSDAAGASSTQTVGATITLDFVGTGIDIRHYADHRGGIWSCVLDGAGSPYLLDTYVASGGPVVTTRLIQGLPFGSHRLVCTLTNTPNPANVSGFNRGWMSIGAVDGDSDSTFDGLGKKNVTFLSTPITMKPPSNIEFAIAARANGSTSDALFLPSHGTGTCFLVPGVDYRVIVDGQDLTMGSTTWIAAEKVVAIGRYYGVHTDDTDYADRLCDIDVAHTVTVDGVHSDVDILWKRAVEVNGYSAMYHSGFASQIETDLGDVISVPPVANTKLTGSPYVGSILGTKPGGTVAEQNLWVVVEWSDSIDEVVRPEDTTTRNQISGQTAIQWIATTGKIYNQVWGDASTYIDVAAGVRQGWNSRIAGGYLA